MKTVEYEHIVKEEYKTGCGKYDYTFEEGRVISTTRTPEQVPQYWVTVGHGHMECIPSTHVRVVKITTTVEREEL